MIYAPRSDKRGSCACGPRVAAPRGIVRAAPRGIVRATHMPSGRLARRMREDAAAPYRANGIEPITIQGKTERAKCRPFLRVEKDAERFAACNALADELGPIEDPKKAVRVVEEAIGGEVNEVFGLMTLDLHGRLKSVAETGRGEPSSVMAPMVPTLQAACLDGAHAVVIFHVHPSGIEAEPSDADKETTAEFAEAFDTIGIILLDHIIVGGDAKRRSYYSFLEDGAL